MNPILALIIANIIWGAAAPVFKFSLTNIPPFTLAFIRFFFASLLFIPFILKFNFRIVPIRYWLLMLLAGFFGITITISFFFLGLKNGTSINAPVIASCGPVFGFIAAVLFLHEKPKKKVFFGMLIAFFGAMIIIFSPIIAGKLQNFGELRGNLFFVISTIGTIVETLILKKVFQVIKPIVAVCLNFFLLSLTFLPFMLLELNTWSFTMIDVSGLTGIFFGVFLSSALAYFLYYYGISKIAVQEVGLFTYMDPVIAVLIAVPLLQEYPNLYFIVGSLSIFVGIFIAEGRLHYHPFHKLKITYASSISESEVVK